MSDTSSGARKSPFEGVGKEELEIRLRQCLNDLRITREEAKESSAKYMEMLNELSGKNVELQTLKEGLEEVLKARNAELMIANESLSSGESEASPESPSKLPGRIQIILRDVIGAAFAGIASGAKARGVELRCGICAPEPERFEADADLSAQLLRGMGLKMLACCGSGARLTVLASASPDGSGPLFELKISGDGVEESRLDELKAFYRRGQEELPCDLLLAEAIGASISELEGSSGFALNLSQGSEWLYDGRPLSGRPLKTLLAESSSARRAAFHHLIRKAGHECVSVCDGRAALAEWKRAKGAGTPFDLLALGAGLCGLDAHGVAMEVRRREESSPTGARTPIVAFVEPPEELGGRPAEVFDGKAEMPIGRLKLDKMLACLCGKSG